MIYQVTARFRKASRSLPKPIKKKVARAFALFRENPHHPSLAVRKIQGSANIWEGRIDRFYRFTFEYVDDPESGETICLFRNIGPHDITKTSP